MTRKQPSKHKKPARPEAETKFPPVVVSTQRELAHLFGVSLSQIRKDIGNDAPTRTGNGYDVKDWITWRVGRRGGKSSAELEQAEIRLKEAKASLAEIELAKIEGQLIDVTEAKRMRERIIAFFISMIDRAPAELSSMVAGKTPRAIRALIKSYFDGARNEAGGRRN